MLRVKRLVTITVIALLLFAVSWLIVKPRVMASVSHETYQEKTYSYEVMLDKYYNAQTRQEEVNGIRVVIHPQPADVGSSLPSEAYLVESEQRLQHWVSTRDGDEPVDVMLVFTRPLTLAQANEVLESSKAQVFESGIVGYVYGVPFADYAVESGPLLVRTLADVAESQQEFALEVESGHIEGADLDIEGEPIDVRGYLAVRVWADVSNLTRLAQNPNVRFVDTTPQAVRDLLDVNSVWQNTPITWLSLKMPVWAYDW